MAVSNVSSKWVDGDLVFYKVEDGTPIMTLSATDAKVLVATLELETQATFQADLVAIVGAPAEADHNGLVTAVNELKDAIVSAGIMAAE